jgi:hypothetical protein
VVNGGVPDQARALEVRSPEIRLGEEDLRSRWHVTANAAADDDFVKQTITWTDEDDVGPIVPLGRLGPDEMMLLRESERPACKGIVDRSAEFVQLLERGDRVALLAKARVSLCYRWFLSRAFNSLVLYSRWDGRIALALHQSKFSTRRNSSRRTQLKRHFPLDGCKGDMALCSSPPTNKKLAISCISRRGICTNIGCMTTVQMKKRTRVAMKRYYASGRMR